MIMDLYCFSEKLTELTDDTKSVYLKFDPEVPDFTTNQPGKLVIYGKDKLEINFDKTNISLIVGMLDVTIFDKSKINIVYVWNLKPFCTYFKFCTGKYIKPQNFVIDLKIAENFKNVVKKSPDELNSAIYRSQAVVDKNFLSIYKKIHFPLITKILPDLETRPLLNFLTKQAEYPYYEVEGQSNGRMNAAKKYSKGYLLHNMSGENKKNFKPKGYEKRFMCADYRHCEVNVLQWLSNDPQLKEIIEDDLDLHQQIYELITGDLCDTERKREISKKIFLPVMYGCQEKTLSNNLSIPENMAKELIKRIKYKFPVVWDWMAKKHKEAENGTAVDYFGRVRNFEKNKDYLSRNFFVQGVAATVCNEKLIKLNNELTDAEVVYCVHDGFGMVVDSNKCKKAYLQAKEILESESELCKGLKLKTQIRFGITLGDLKVFWQ